MSLTYVAQRLKAGDLVTEHIERLDSQISRVNTALRECYKISEKK